MKPPYFTRVSTGSGNLFGAEFFSWMLSAIPSILSDDNLENLATKVEPEHLLVPVLSLSVAGIVGLFYDHFSAITIGFGSVLLGVTIDFAVHVYFALPDDESKKAAVLDEVSIPIVFGALTTVACFVVLLFSPLPGLRQVSSFSIVGICAAFLISLITFPHFIGVSPRRGVFQKRTWKTRSQKFGIVIIIFWSCLMLACIWKTTGTTFDGDDTDIQTES
ncbi:MAG: hypothetical protein WCR46_16700 [Deltaproteobacteria bacterium]